MARRACARLVVSPRPRGLEQHHCLCEASRARDAQRRAPELVAPIRVCARGQEQLDDG